MPDTHRTLPSKNPWLKQHRGVDAKCLTVFAVMNSGGTDSGIGTVEKEADDEKNSHPSSCGY